MVFIADALGAWLVAALADASRKRLTTIFLGSDQERALYSAAKTAVRMTANELRPDDDEHAEHLALVISQVFSEPMHSASPIDHQTILQSLRAGIAAQLAVLDDTSLTGAGRSSAHLLAVPGAVLADKLTDHLLREIIVRGSRGGPLQPLAAQLNHDLTHLQGQQINDAMHQLGAQIQDSFKRLRIHVVDDEYHAASAHIRAWSAADFPPDAAGIHRAIVAEGQPSDERLPLYVRRAHDKVLRRYLSGASARGKGLVLLAGTPSTGKTRAAWEAIREPRFADWLVVCPESASAVRGFCRKGSIKQPIFLWLDELQRFLAPGEAGLSGIDVDDMFELSAPVIVIATIWPELYQEFRSPPHGLYSNDPVNDHFASARRFLDRADEVIMVPSGLSSESEMLTARRLADSDLRIGVALSEPNFGFTEALAGGRELVQYWKVAASPPARALVSLAADAHRIGCYEHVSVELLRNALPGYLTSRRVVPSGWIDDAFAEVTAPLAVPVTAMIPIRGKEPDIVGGYQVADYLLKIVITERAKVSIPDALWDAAGRTIHDHQTLERLAVSSEARGRFRYTGDFLHKLSTSGDRSAQNKLADFLEERDRFAEAEPIRRNLIENTEGNLDTIAMLAALTTCLERQGKDEQDAILERVYECGGHRALAAYLHRLAAEKSRLEALANFARLADADDLRVRSTVSKCLTSFGQTEASRTLQGSSLNEWAESHRPTIWTDGIISGSMNALKLMVWHLLVVGEVDRSDNLRRYGVDAQGRVVSAGTDAL